MRDLHRSLSGPLLRCPSVVAPPRRLAGALSRALAPLLTFSALVGIGLAHVRSLTAQEPPTGQPAALTGAVTLSGQGGWVPGVRIRVVGLNRESMTDATGHYVLPLPSGTHEVRAELVGCAPSTWTVRVPPGQTTLDLSLSGPAINGREHSELVDPGTGAMVSGSALSYTVDRLGAGDMETSSGRTITDLIRAAAPGVRVVQGSGMPGESISIVLRGPTSISGQQDPLVSIDGLVTGGGLDDLDPRDVESIQLLKGSVATATYGSRGGAGVIEIRTKRGTPDRTARCFFRSRLPV